MLPSEPGPAARAEPEPAAAPWIRSGVVPAPTALARFGRSSVLALRTTSRRRVFAPVLRLHPVRSSPGASTEPMQVGSPVASREIPPSSATWDWHLRRELVARLFDQAASTQTPGADGQPETSAGSSAGDRHCAADQRTTAVLLVSTRPGAAEAEDADHAWWAAATSAATELDLRLLCLVVVTRWGWLTLPEGPQRHWTRLRDRNPRSSPGTATNGSG